MININNNQCPVCLTDGLSWNLNHNKSQMEMFKCGHGTCKDCYSKIAQYTGFPRSFSCPLCRGDEQQHTIGFLSNETGSWTTFAEWYNDYEIYIKSGVAKNVVKNSRFGQQLMRLIRESRNANLTTKSINKKSNKHKNRNIVAPNYNLNTLCNSVSNINIVSP